MLIVLTASIASTAIGANKSSSLEPGTNAFTLPRKVKYQHGKNSSPANDLTGHTRLGSVDQSFSAQRVHLDAQLVLHELDCLPTREPVPGDDRRRVDLLLDQLVCPAQELRSDDHHGSCPIPDLLVLLLS
jgi:hypothetical protein